MENDENQQTSFCNGVEYVAMSIQIGQKFNRQRTRLAHKISLTNFIFLRIKSAYAADQAYYVSIAWTGNVKYFFISSFVLMDV